MPQQWPRTWLLLYGLAFAAAHTQAPLYFSNQNQYFLHGLAAAGHGDLAGDWLANTRDPTPIFSAFVALVARQTSPELFRVVYFCWLALYAVVIVRLVEGVTRWSACPIGMAMFLVVHAAVARWLSGALLGVDWPWYFQAGVAGQYLLGPSLQPSVFGVLLLAGLAAFAHGRLLPAAFLTSLAGLLHATYLLHAGLITLGYLIALGRDRRWRAAVLTAGIALATVAPAVTYNVVQFAPTNAASFAAAQRILAYERIPHHTVFQRWLDWVAVLQIGWCIAGVWLMRGSRLVVPVGVAGLGAMALSASCFLTASPTLALLFPWRISAVLMPAATALIFNRVFAVRARRFAFFAATSLSSMAVIGSVWLVAGGRGYAQDSRDELLMRFVREHRVPGDCYLLPVRMPPPSESTGSISTTFVPMPGPSSFQFERFRLATGARVYVDVKSIPYADVEVLEWRRRMAVAEEAPTEASFQREKVTHAVTPRDRPLATNRLIEVYADDNFRMYRLRKNEAADAPPAAEGG